jgi:hypothetical protein
MNGLKTSIIVLLMAGIAIAGCVSSGNNTGPKIVATVGAPTPIPTEPPEPTVGPTWTPTPTPVPPAVTLSGFSLTVVINGDQRQWTGDPNKSGELNAQYATRQDTVTFNVQNTGDATLQSLVIIYKVSTPISVTDSSGRTSSTNFDQIKNSTIGTLKPGESRDITIVSPMYGAMLDANVTVTAIWNGGSLDLYMATLEPNFSSGTTYTPANDLSVRMYGSAYN